jgi:hypothetical protein
MAGRSGFGVLTSRLPETSGLPKTSGLPESARAHPAPGGILVADVKRPLTG